MSVVKVQVAVPAQFRFSTDTIHMVAVEAVSPGLYFCLKGLLSLGWTRFP